MVIKDIINYLEKEGMDKLYKKYEQYFNELDKWSEIFANSELLDEYQLSHALDRCTGIYMKFSIVAEGINAFKTNKELNYSAKAFRECKGKPNVSQIGLEARQSTEELRVYRADFLNYANSAEKCIGTCQSRIKRLTVEKGARGVDFTGDVGQAEQNKQIKKGWA